MYSKKVRSLSWEYLKAKAKHDPRLTKALRIRFAPNNTTKRQQWWAKRVIWDNSANLVREYRKGNKYRYQKAHEVLGYLLTHRRIAPHTSLYLYSGIITFKNMRANAHNQLLTSSGTNGYDLLKAVERKLRDYFKGDYTDRSKGQRRINHHAFMLVHSIECSFFKGMRRYQKTKDDRIFNLHEHVVFGLINEVLPISHNHFTLWKTLMDYINQYFNITINISIRPLINKQTQTDVVVDNSTTDSDWNTIFATTWYDLKQSKLPVPKSKDDVKAFREYPYKTKALETVLNSVPMGMQLHGVMDFKQKERTQNAILLQMIFATLKLFKGFSLKGKQKKNSNNNITNLIRVLSFKHFEDLPPPFTL